MELVLVGVISLAIWVLYETEVSSVLELIQVSKCEYTLANVFRRSTNEEEASFYFFWLQFDLLNTELVLLLLCLALFDHLVRTEITKL